jgi:hypothetical protein
MLGAETLDHIAIPVRDLEKSEGFYLAAVRSSGEQANVFILKPAAEKGKVKDSIRAGDTVMIEAGGARRLGKRKLEFCVV